MTQILSFLSVFFFSVLSFSAAENITCVNGTLDEKGDGLLMVEFTKSGVSINPWETSVMIDKDSISMNGNSFSVMNYETMASSEGMEFPVKVNAMIVMNDDFSKGTIFYGFGETYFHSEELKCGVDPFAQ